MTLTLPRARASFVLCDHVRSEHRQWLSAMLDATPAFDRAEVDVALELLDHALERPDQSDYRFLFAEDGRGLAGYVCFGPTPMTEGTFDLYWLATHPDHQRRGVAGALVAAMEAKLTAERARLVRVETSSQEAYGGARRFYLRAGYEETAVLSDFYRPGDDLVIFTKRLSGPSNVVAPGRTDFELIYDIAFGYRDFDAERDFLRACSHRWGRGEPARVLEWASGPSRHLESFARAGIPSLGVDISPAMVDLARRRFGHLPDVSIVEGDMRHVEIEAPVDLAFTMLSSIHTLPSEADLVAHLATSSRALRDGGLYVIEATHPRDLTRSGANETRWEQRERDAVVHGHFAFDTDSLKDGRVLATLELSHVVGDQRRHYRLDMPWLVLELDDWRRAIARVPELELVATLGDLALDAPFDKPTAWRLVLVLRKV